MKLRILFSATGSSLHVIKYAADVCAPLERVLALCAEYDLLSVWQPGVMIDASILHTERNREVTYGGRLDHSCLCFRHHAESYDIPW